MKWTWQLDNWPNFGFDVETIQNYELEYLKNSGKLFGATIHLDDSQKEQIKINLLAEEAYSTSFIEGEILNRDSVQSSIGKHLGIKVTVNKSHPRENGISEMLVDLYLNFKKALSHKMLFAWHEMLMNRRRDLDYIGAYRKHDDAMQIVSANIGTPKLFYEAPPSKTIPAEMKQYITWFNNAAQDKTMPTVVFAAIAHIYFEQIHPFEDGNGRIGRALAEKALSIRLNMPSLNSISKIIEQDKTKYYDSFFMCNQSLNLNNYLKYFSTLLLAAQDYSYETVVFIIAKNKLFTKFQYQLNDRQTKVIIRIFDEGIEGFKGGLSAKNYRSISHAPHATATRDLQALTEIGVLTKTGELKSTRYFLNLKSD